MVGTNYDLERNQDIILIGTLALDGQFGGTCYMAGRIRPILPNDRNKQAKLPVDSRKNLS